MSPITESLSPCHILKPRRLDSEREARVSPGQKEYVTKKSSASAVLSCRIRQKQIELHLLRKRSTEFQSLFPQFQDEAKFSPVPYLYQRVVSPDNANAKDELSRTLFPLDSNHSTARNHRLIYGRANSADFDATRCRDLQVKRASSSVVLAQDHLELQTKAQRLYKLPNLKASPETFHALSALAQKWDDAPTPISLRLPLSPPTTIHSNLFEEHNDPSPNKAISAEEEIQIVSILDIDTHITSSFDYPTIPTWSLYVYILLIVVGMGLFFSSDPYTDIVYEFKSFKAFLESTVKIAQTTSQQAVPVIRNAILYFKDSAMETYLLCNHISVVFYTHMKKRVLGGKIATLGPARLLVPFNTTLLGDMNLPTPILSEENMYVESGNEPSTSAEKAVITPGYANSISPTPDPFAMEWDGGETVGAYESALALKDDEASTWALGDARFINDLWQCSIDLIGPIPAHNQLFYLPPIDPVSTSWVKEWTVSIDAPEDDFISFLLNRARIKAQIHSLEEWLQTKHRQSDHVRGIKSLILGANWITIGTSASDVSYR